MGRRPNNYLISYPNRNRKLTDTILAGVFNGGGSSGGVSYNHNGGSGGGGASDINVKEAALFSLLLIYILYIDLIHNVTHNTYTYVHSQL